MDEHRRTNPTTHRPSDGPPSPVRGGMGALDSPRREILPSAISIDATPGENATEKLES